MYGSLTSSVVLEVYTKPLSEVIIAMVYLWVLRGTWGQRRRGRANEEAGVCVRKTCCTVSKTLVLDIEF